MVENYRKAFFQSERLSRRFFAPSWVWKEHLARYTFALGFVDGKHVVDCACGEGIASKMLAQSGAKQVECFDVSKDAIGRAQTQCSSKNIRFRVAEGTRLPLPKGFAEVFLSFETIEHMHEDRAFLQEVARCMKADGIFLCSTPNRGLANPGRTLADTPLNTFHVREYDGKEFVELLKTTFKTVEVYGQNPQHALKTWLVRVFEKVLPSCGGLGMRLFFKIPRLVFCGSAWGTVQSIQKDYDYEYWVAVCRGPRQFHEDIR